MKFLLVAAVFACAPVLRAEDNQPAAAPPSAKATREKFVRAILEEGKTAKRLHSAVFIRVQAQLGRSTPADAKLRADAEARGIDFKKKLDETWEFTTNQVHRVISEQSKKNGETLAYRRVESRPFDTSNLCKELLDGKLLAIGEDEEGECRQFVGTEYNIGHRAIDVFVNGKSVLWTGESCLEAGFHEKDAVAFATLYETLAKQARAAFEVKDR